MNTNDTNQQAINAFLQLFEWAYEVEFKPEQRAAIEAEIWQGWSNMDNSDLELLDYILRLHDIFARSDKAQINQLRTQARTVFASHFPLYENNDRSRILATVFRAIQELNGGVLPIQNLPEPSFGPASPVAQTQQKPASQEPPDPADMAALKRREDMRQLEIQMQQYIWEKRVETSREIWRQ